MQGTAADLIKVAMVRIRKRLIDGRFRARMILQVHDELVFEAPETEIDRLAPLVRGEMEGALDLVVPIAVELGTGRDWLEAHE